MKKQRTVLGAAAAVILLLAATAIVLQSSGEEIPPVVLHAQAAGPHTIEVTFSTKLQHFEPGDLVLLAATGNWDTRLNADLNRRLTVKEVTARTVKGRTVATFEVEETLKEDGTIDLGLPAVLTANRIPLLSSTYYSGISSRDIQSADHLLTWQLDTGGWDKSITHERPWNGIERRSGWLRGNVELGTIDNDATINEIIFLTVMYNQTEDVRYKEAVRRGVEFLLTMQYPSGGFPQVYPARGNYSDYVTFNDDAMPRVMLLLQRIAQEQFPFHTDILTDADRERVGEAVQKGVEYILNAQIVVDGKLTAWGQQHDPVTYEPREGRAYEHPSISAMESVGVVVFLMSIQDPDERVATAIESAMRWFEEAKVEGLRLDRNDPKGEYLVEDPSSTIWYRFYEIGTNRPIFSGRDGVIKHRLNEIELERIQGYNWAGGYAHRLINTVHSTGYYENRVYVRTVGYESVTKSGLSLEAAGVVRVEPGS